MVEITFLMSCYIFKIFLIYFGKVLWYLINLPESRKGFFVGFLFARFPHAMCILTTTFFRLKCCLCFNPLMQSCCIFCMEDSNHQSPKWSLRGKKLTCHLNNCFMSLLFQQGKDCQCAK